MEEDSDDDEQAKARRTKGPNVVLKHSMIILIKCLNSFADKCTGHIFESVKNAIAANLNDRELIGTHYSILSELAKETDTSVKQCALLMSILEEREKFLEATQTNSKFSWRMPNAKIHAHPKIEEFLKSDQAEMEYKVEDKNKLFDLVTDFNERYMQDDYSATFIKKSANVVLVKKTKRWFEDQEKLKQRYQAELKVIKAYLKKHKL